MQVCADRVDRETPRHAPCRTSPVFFASRGSRVRVSLAPPTQPNSPALPLLRRCPLLVKRPSSAIERDLTPSASSARHRSLCGQPIEALPGARVGGPGSGTPPCRSHVLATSHDCVQPKGADHETDADDNRKEHPENHPLASRCHAASLRRWTATGCRGLIRSVWHRRCHTQRWRTSMGCSATPVPTSPGRARKQDPLDSMGCRAGSRTQGRNMT